MISHYTSRHPGLYLYLILVSASVLSFLYLELQASHIGILSIVWGGFILMRVLSLYEVNTHNAPLKQDKQPSKNTNRNSAPLAHDLLCRMRKKQHYKHGLLALHALHGRTILWFILALICVAYYIFLAQEGKQPILIVQDTALFFMIGAAFWAGQSYAYSQRATYMLLLVCGVLLGIVLFMLTEGFQNINSITLRTMPHIFLIFLFLYSAVTLIYAVTRSAPARLYGVLGLGLIVLLLIAYIMVGTNAQTPALWIVGGSLFSVFWMRADMPINVRYTLYQCE